jgi:ribonucleoside-diphosphate reductase alpha chain
MNVRAVLPNRRVSQTIRFDNGGHRYYATMGYASLEDRLAGKPMEVFVDAGQPGSALQHVTRDAAVILSLALQYGAPVSVLRDAVTRLDNGAPAGPFGCLLDLLKKEET